MKTTRQKWDDTMDMSEIDALLGENSDDAAEKVAALSGDLPMNLWNFLAAELQIAAGATPPSSYEIPKGFLPVEVSTQAVQSLEKNTDLITCHALCEPRESRDQDLEVVRILDAEKGWLDAYNAARIMELDVYEIIARRGWKIEREARITHPLSKMGELPKKSFTEKRATDGRLTVPSDFSEIITDENIVGKKKVQRTTTTFRATMLAETGTIMRVWTNDIPWGAIQKNAYLVQGHICLIKASRIYTYSGFAKLVKTARELKKG